MFDFDDDVLDQLETPAEPQQEPVLVCFYSGGFYHNDGRKLLNDLLESAAKKGIGDTLVLGFPDHYGIKGEGYEWWPIYVDRLVEELIMKVMATDHYWFLVTAEAVVLQ